MSARPEPLPAFESLDRLAQIEMRPPTSPAGIVGPFYELVRRDGPPLTYRIAQDLLNRRGGPALIVTGLVDTVRFPHGEIDGPIGSLALARCLSLLGADVTIAIDPEARGPVTAILEQAGLTSSITLHVAQFPDAESARTFAQGFDAVIAVEKLGRNAIGGRHLIWGTPVDVGDPFADDYIQGAKERGALTVGVGDNGNEIGFGNIGEAAEPLTPPGVTVDGGFFAATAVDHLLPASISNLGCYAIVAALAILADNADLVLPGGVVRGWTELGLAAGLRSGGVDDPDFQGDDGVPLRYVEAHAELLAGVVHQALLDRPRIAALTGAPV
ncbi:glutamate cyclase domain-containing protein [Streptomyces chartreusis]|uniref:glutamate cyclase domain-containing protein n=1 Tax=Streptomyces chartreusis TaxID=1969 RepID=UPI00369C2411